ncbi:MAG TPA: hypothetical protein VFK16_10500 [Gemmatimonadaceae bacterium]|jgi:hypothetical protein|nr:hypothetical protein [Gemmatimonadaceae bacterium]
MRGVKYLYNARGRKTTVLIDLEKSGDVWEDLLDAALAEERASEPTARWAAVRRRLERGGRLKPVTKRRPTD